MLLIPCSNDENRPSLYSQLARPKAEQEFLQALIAPLDGRPSDGLSPQDPFQVIYRHLHEKHYIDRLIHAFYHRPTRSQQLSSSPADLGRIAFRKCVNMTTDAHGVRLMGKRRVCLSGCSDSDGDDDENDDGI